MGTVSSETKLNQLLRLTARGWRLFPVKVRDKQPLVADWPNQATNDQERLQIWLKTFPGCNWGLATGPDAGIFVVDVDGEQGTQSLHDLERNDCALPKTLTVRTGRGTHIYLEWPPNGTVIRNSAGRIAPGLDVRGAAGYVVVPPSVHPSGASYQFVEEEAPIAPAPEWLLERLAQPPVGSKSDSRLTAQARGKRIPEGKRNAALASLAGAMQRKGVAPSTIEAALLVENRERCNPPLPEAEVREIARSISRYDPVTTALGAHARHPDLLTLSQVEPREVDWLWKFYLARGMLAMLSGDPGAGKTFIVLAIAADITVGRIPSTDDPRAPGDVLYLSIENSAEYVIRPRFDSLGGNPCRFHLLRGSITGDGGEPERGDVRLSDVTLLHNALLQTKAELVIVDPIQSYLGADVDAHRSNETRPVMDGLSRLAEKHHCCILLVRHLGKAQTDKAIHRGLGSIDLTGAVRTELLAGCSPDDPDQRAVVQMKSNLGQFGSSLGYTIEADGTFHWSGESSLTAGKILAPEPDGEEVGAVAEAGVFLRETLALGPRPSMEVEKEAHEQGISKRTLKRAKQKLRVQSRKRSMGSPWEWTLPEGCQ